MSPPADEGVSVQEGGLRGVSVQGGLSMRGYLSRGGLCLRGVSL